ncbi:uncharacterized protein V3H82_011841 [Fundulus diaphanus]
MRTCNRLSVLIVNLIFFTPFPDLQAQKLEVTPKVTGILAQEVILRCQFFQGPDNTSITQIQWDFVSDKENITILVFNSEYGMTIKESSLRKRVNLTEQSLKIIDVKMTDAGLYACSITVFPSGSFEATTRLVVVDGEPVSEQKQTKISAGILSAIIISAALLLVILTAAVYLSFIKRHNTGRRHQVLIDTSSRVGSVTRPSYIIKDPEVVYADVRTKKPRKTTSSLNKNPQTAAMAEEVTYAEVKVYHQRPNLETVFSL